MKVLLDTNIVLDLLLHREPYSLSAKEIFSLIESKKISAYLCATTITTIHYLLSKKFSKKQQDEVINDLLKLFSIADVNKGTLKLALQNNDLDFEDSVIYSSAELSNVDIIISRDKKGSKNSKILTQSSEVFLASYKQLKIQGQK